MVFHTSCHNQEMLLGGVYVATGWSRQHRRNWPSSLKRNKMKLYLKSQQRPSLYFIQILWRGLKLLLLLPRVWVFDTKPPEWYITVSTERDLHLDNRVPGTSIGRSRIYIQPKPAILQILHTARARIFKRLWSPGIDSKEWIPPAYVVWRAGTITLFLFSS